jgi:hypothetical protein
MPAAHKEMAAMKRSAIALVLFALAAWSPCLAQTPAQTPAPANVADFLAILSGTESATPGAEALPTGPKLLSTLCDSNADCPTGQLCCYPCGIPDCHNVCMEPVRKRCPMFP